jgi:hypothetical protein
MRACEARPATAKCGGAKSHKGACADWSFAEPEPPEQGGEHIPFVKCWFLLFIHFLFSYF